MNLYITRNYGNKNTKNAGSKAPLDINRICNRSGWQEIVFELPAEDATKFEKLKFFLFKCPMQWMQLGKSTGAVVLYQHPMYFGTKIAVHFIPFLKKHFHIRFVVLLHDLESLRERATKSEQKFIYKDIELVKHADVVICHNKKMKQYLIDCGVKSDKLIELGIFDYLYDLTKQIGTPTTDVVIAGNLSPQKCGYIYKLASENPNLKISLYGIGLDETLQTGNMRYRGSFSPEELPQKLDAKYGLVWDGPEITTCCGPFGEYLKYNNPHKLSLFMAAGIPVITWKEAAIADFVKEQNVGILVDSLCNLKNELGKVTDEEYEIMKKNAEKISLKVREGYYFKTALDKAVKLCIK